MVNTSVQFLLHTPPLRILVIAKMCILCCVFIDFFSISERDSAHLTALLVISYKY